MRRASSSLTSWLYAHLPLGGSVRFDGGLVHAGTRPGLVLWESGQLVDVVFAGARSRVRRVADPAAAAPLAGANHAHAAAAQALVGVEASRPHVSGGPVEVLLHVVAEDPAMGHWEGWTRAFAGIVEGYVREDGAWRLLGRFRAKTAAFAASGLRTPEIAGVQVANTTCASVWLRTGETWWGLAGQPWTSPVTELPARDGAPEGSAEPEEWGTLFDPGPRAAWAPPVEQARCQPLEEPAIPLPTGAAAAVDWCTPQAGTVLPALHLWWELPQEPVSWLFNTITVDQAAPGTYYMGIGWLGGYMGIQQHANASERYVLFSVWDAGDIVKATKVGGRVDVARFGLEGTGMNSHRRLAWREGEPVHLAVHATLLDDGRTSYSGYAHIPGGPWHLIAEFTTRPCGGNSWLSSPNSFLEVWAPSPLCEHRKAHYGPMFYRAATQDDGLKRGLRAGANGAGWRRASRVRVSATCGLQGGAVPCPPFGLDARPDVLEVGRPVANTIAHHFVSDEHAVLSAPLHGDAPGVLAGPLPVGDKSPAPDTRDAGLHRWGQAGALEGFGAKAYDDAVCPWYVEDCDY